MKKPVAFIISMLLMLCGFAQGEWSIIHPTPTLNNLNDVHFLSEDEGWAVGYQGTILYTINGGQDWELQHSSDEESFWGVFFIDSLEGWACGWNMIYHTADAGASWEAQAHPSCKGDFTDVFFISPDTGWIVGRYKIVLKTTDGGQTWIKIMNNIYQENGFKRVDFCDHLHGCAVGDNLGGYPHTGFVMVTEDGGDSWTETTPESCSWLTDVEYYNDSSIWICGYDAGLYKSTDGGKTWDKTSTYNSFNEVHFFNADDGMLLESWSARRSYDAGLSWDTQIMIDDFTGGYRAFMSWEDAKGVAVGGDGVMSMTLDGCHTWHPIHHGLRLHMGQIGFFNTFDGLALGGTAWEPELLRTTDGGYSWSYDSLVGNGPFTDMFMKGQLCCLLNQDSLLVVKTADGGNSWQAHPLPPTNEYYRELFFVNENTGYISDKDGKLIKTTDGGLSWATLPLPGYNELCGMYFFDEANGWLIEYDDKLILHTADGGISWSANPLGNGLIYQPGCLWFTDANTGILHTEEGWMFTSQDGGETWEEWGFLSAGSYARMHFFDESEGWLLCGRLFHTLDGGMSWDEGESLHNITRSMYFLDNKRGWAGGTDGMIAVYDGSVGMAEGPQPETGVQLFPNPATDQLNVLMGDEPGEVLISIYDLQGRELLEHLFRNNGAPIRLSVAGLPPGSYMLQLRSGQKQLSAKFVKSEI